MVSFTRTSYPVCCIRQHDQPKHCKELPGKQTSLDTPPILLSPPCWISWHEYFGSFRFPFLSRCSEMLFNAEVASLFSCPVDGCVKTYFRSSSVRPRYWTCWNRRSQDPTWWEITVWWGETGLRTQAARTGLKANPSLLMKTPMKPNQANFRFNISQDHPLTKSRKIF